MKQGVLLDSSYLISLVDAKRKNHAIAGQYFRLMTEQQHRMVLSAIVVAELAVKQPITDFPLDNFLILPFNIPHAIEAARLWNALQRDQGDDRAVVKDDVKLMAQAEKEVIPFLLTEDASTLYKYCERLRIDGCIKLKAIKLKDGFDPGVFGVLG